MHKAKVGERRKELRKRAQELDRGGKGSHEGSRHPAPGQLSGPRAEGRGRSSQGKKQRPLSTWIGWRISPSGSWRRSKARKKADGRTSTGWPPGGRIAIPGMCIWGAVRKWMRRQSCIRPGRRRPGHWGSSPDIS
jgi:hypothetical protein